MKANELEQVYLWIGISKIVVCIKRVKKDECLPERMVYMTIIFSTHSFQLFYYKG